MSDKTLLVRGHVTVYYVNTQLLENIIAFFLLYSVLFEYDIIFIIWENLPAFIRPPTVRQQTTLILVSNKLRST